jgi:MGT family glycosyltransferase
VVTDLFLLGAQIAAERAGVPRAMLAPNLFGLPGWGVPPLGPGFTPARGALGRARDRVAGGVLRRLFDTALDPLNAVRADHGLAPVASVLDQIADADRLLILSSPAFEYEGFAPPPNVEITGPRLDDPAWAGADWTPPPGDAPLVLVGLTSTYMEQTPLLQRITTALGALPVRGLVTTGPCVDPSSISAPENVSVVRAAPHSAVLREAAAVVTHAGHGTVIKALAAGVPVLAMPLGRDQLDNATRVAFHGAGLKLSPKAAPAKIATAVGRLLAEPAFAAGARRQAQAIADITREDRTTDALEELAGVRTRGEAVAA